jgi:hypothetical protein
MLNSQTTFLTDSGVLGGGFDMLGVAPGALPVAGLAQTSPAGGLGLEAVPQLLSELQNLGYEKGELESLEQQIDSGALSPQQLGSLVFAAQLNAMQKKSQQPASLLVGNSIEASGTDREYEQAQLLSPNSLPNNAAVSPVGPNVIVEVNTDLAVDLKPNVEVDQENAETSKVSYMTPVVHPDLIGLYFPVEEVIVAGEQLNQPGPTLDNKEVNLTGRPVGLQNPSEKKSLGAEPTPILNNTVVTEVHTQPNQPIDDLQPDLQTSRVVDTSASLVGLIATAPEPITSEESKVQLFNPATGVTSTVSGASLLELPVREVAPMGRADVNLASSVAPVVTPVVAPIVASPLAAVNLVEGKVRGEFVNPVKDEAVNPVKGELNQVPTPVILKAAATESSTPVVPNQPSSNLQSSNPPTSVPVSSSPLSALVSPEQSKSTLVQSVKPSIKQASLHPAKSDLSAQEPLSDFQVAGSSQRPVGFPNQVTTKLALEQAQTQLQTDAEVPAMGALQWIRQSKAFNTQLQQVQSSDGTNVELLQMPALADPIPTQHTTLELNGPLEGAEPLGQSFSIAGGAGRSSEGSATSSNTTPSQQLMDTVKEALKTIETRLPGRLELGLNLKDGDRVSLQISTQGNRMDVALEGLSQSMLDSLAESSGQLSRMLESVGYQVSSLKLNGDSHLSSNSGAPQNGADGGQAFQSNEKNGGRDSGQRQQANSLRADLDALVGGKEMESNGQSPGLSLVSVYV